MARLNGKKRSTKKGDSVDLQKNMFDKWKEAFRLMFYHSWIEFENFELMMLSIMDSSNQNVFVIQINQITRF